MDWHDTFRLCKGMKDFDLDATIACLLIASRFVAVPFCLLACWPLVPHEYRQIKRLFDCILAVASGILLGIYELRMQQYNIRIDGLVVWPAAAITVLVCPYFCFSTSRRLNENCR